uniref:hypothetical protein n=1 Tax=Pseudopedobacter sp. TaxID=1936787 RepID=UPI00334201D5
MKNSYPTKYEIYEALMMTSASFTRMFAQKLGLIVTNSKQDVIAKEISRIFLEEEDIEVIRSEAYQQKVNHSLSGFTVLSKHEYFSLVKNFNWILESKKFKTGIVLNSLKKLDEGNVYRGAYSYKRKKPGRIELLQDEENSFDFYLKDVGKGEWNVEIDSTRSTDLKELMDLFEPTLKKDEEKIESLDEKLLNTKNSIEFFDELSKFGKKEHWGLVQISHVSIRKNAMESETEDVEQKDLDGISQAIIEGKNLRENQFVENAVSSGFSFTAMTYEFENTKKPIGF